MIVIVGCNMSNIVNTIAFENRIDKETIETVNYIEENYDGEISAEDIFSITWVEYETNQETSNFSLFGWVKKLFK